MSIAKDIRNLLSGAVGGGCTLPPKPPCSSGRGSRPSPNHSLFLRGIGKIRNRLTTRVLPSQIWPKTLWLNGFEFCPSSFYHFLSVAHIGNPINKQRQTEKQTERQTVKQTDREIPWYLLIYTGWLMMYTGLQVLLLSRMLNVVDGSFYINYVDIGRLHTASVWALHAYIICMHDFMYSLMFRSQLSDGQTYNN